MKKTSVLVLAALLTLGVACNLFGSPQAESEETGIDFPTRSIQLVVPFAAGGSTDALARVLADAASDFTEQSIVVTNRTGAGGTIATTEVANAAPDGYKILLNAIGPFMTQPYFKDVSYEIDDFRGIIGLKYAALFIAVNADSPWETVEDMQSADRVITYGHPGTGSFTHLVQAGVFAEAGVEAEDVPFDGGRPAMTAVLGGKIDSVAGHPSGLDSYVEAGDFRLLGVASSERSEKYPNIPTFQEQGYDIEMGVWNMVVAPKDTPDPIIDRLHDIFEQAVNTDQFQQYLANNAAEPLDLHKEEVIVELKEGAEQTGQLLESMGYSR